MFLLHGVNEELERSHKKRDHIQKPWRRFGVKHREAGSEGTSPRVCIMDRPGGWMRFGVLDLTGQWAGYPREQVDPIYVQCIKYLTFLRRLGSKDVGRKGVGFSFTKMADLIWDQI